MLATASARLTARNCRLTAARDYATEVALHAEQQANLGLEDKILGNLSGIVMEAIDCLQNDQPFRSASLSMLSLELLSYLRQANKPMVVNFACAFTMLMSELEGLDLSERREDCPSGERRDEGSRSYSNSIPDVPPDATVTERPSAAPTTSSASIMVLPRPPVAPASSHAVDSLVRVAKEEPIAVDQGRLSVEAIDYDDDTDLSIKSDQHSWQGVEVSLDDGVSKSSYRDDATSQQALLQRMLANFSTPSTSTQDFSQSARSEAARNQLKSTSGRFESRDDELAAKHNLPVSAAEIETMPDQDMARILRSDSLSEQQRSIMRQIRKRARSKISSREYRRRKEAKRLEESFNSSTQ